jgi:2-polyprenyl-6-methoxyphenol hydroxylase-like FAD-dependent oxidoreductase
MPRAVLRAGSSPEALLAEHVARIPRVAARATGTRPSSPVHVESDYSYLSDRLTGPNWALVGDAGCFVDPIFSGGVYLALLTGIEAAAAVAGALDGLDEGARSLARYERLYKTGYDTYARLIYAYYESKFALGRYLQQMGVNLDEQGFPRILGGDFWSADNPIGTLLRSNPEWDTFAPFDPLLECPVYGPAARPARLAPAGG